MKLRLQEKSIALFLLTTGVVLNYVFDGLNKIGKLHIPVLSRSAIIYRLLFEIICILLILIFLNKKRLSWLSVFVYFIICFIIGNIYIKYIIGIDIVLLEQFIYFNRYFFIFFVFFATYKAIKNRFQLNIAINSFKKIFLLNGVLAIFGLLFSIKLFSTFPTGVKRFGYDGLIYAQNEASIFYLLGLFVFYYDWRYKKRPLKNLIFVLFLCLLTGMKAVILGIGLLASFHFFSTVNLKKLLYIIFGSIAGAAIIILSFSKLKILFAYYYYFFINKGFIFTILGGRNTFIESRVIPYLEKWGGINYLIGGQNISNITDNLALVEMDFIDLFLFFGAINAAFFLWFYKKHIIGGIKNKFFLFVVCLFFLLAFFSGHFFTSSVNPIFIIIVFTYINTSLNENTRNIAAY